MDKQLNVEKTHFNQICIYTIKLLDLNVRDTGDFKQKNPDHNGWGFCLSEDWYSRVLNLTNDRLV